MHVIDKIKTVHEGWGRFHLVTVRNGAGETFVRQVEDHGEAVCVLPYDPGRGCVMLVRQPRVGPLFTDRDSMLVEAPAGLTDGESPAIAGMREVEEETGIALAALEPAGSLWTMPGCATERMHCFLAPYCAGDRVSAGGGAPGENEEIETVELPLAEAFAMLKDGRIEDMKTTYLLQALALRHPGLAEDSGGQADPGASRRS
ncbi:MAG: NUDIX hydrolase [Pseudomonadota bacterium]|nr:NUDIX hydrolase [Pseudomonadota bacterium]